MSYEINGEFIVKDGIYFIPKDDENMDYRVFKEWMTEGNTPGIAMKHPRDIKSEIAQMEAAALMPRATREFMLGLMEAQFTPEQLQLNPGYTKVKLFDNQIKELRASI